MIVTCARPGCGKTTRFQDGYHRKYCSASCKLLVIVQRKNAAAKRRYQTDPDYRARHKLSVYKSYHALRVKVKTLFPR
jgi:hypothetical protein